MASTGEVVDLLDDDLLDDPAESADAVAGLQVVPDGRALRRRINALLDEGRRDEAFALIRADAERAAEWARRQVLLAELDELQPA